MSGKLKHRGALALAIAVFMVAANWGAAWWQGASFALLASDAVE